MSSDKPTVNVEGRDWHLFSVNWSDAEGRQFSFHIYAISREHASYIVEEIRNTATLGDQIASIIK
ncbi:hypothetical protein [Enterobacter cloacae]